MKLTAITIALALLVVVLPTLPVSHAELVSDKKENKNRENLRFCGTEDDVISNERKTCQSFWLPPVRHDLLFIQAASACAVCWYTGPGCAACSYAAVAAWFRETALAQAGAIQNIPDQVGELAGQWLANIWDQILDGSAWYYYQLGGYRIDARGAILTHCSRECVAGVCTPTTCLQNQGLIQLKIEREGRYIFLENDADEKIWAAIRYKDPLTNEWVSKCWYGLDSSEGFFTATDGGRITTKNSIIYIYASNADGSMVWNGDGYSGSRVRSCRGETMNMRKFRYSGDGDIEVRFTGSRRMLSEGNLRGVNSTVLTEASPIVSVFDLPQGKLNSATEKSPVCIDSFANMGTDIPCNETLQVKVAFAEQDGLVNFTYNMMPETAELEDEEDGGSE